MAILAITDGKIFVDGFNLSAAHNELSVDASAEMKDVTTFASGGTRVFKPGLMAVKMSGKGFQDFDSAITNPIDKTIFERIGAVAAVLTAARAGNAEGDVAYSYQGVHLSVTPVVGAIGDMFSFTLDGEGGGSRLLRGLVMAVGTKGTTGLGTATNLGAVSATQRVYGALHCTGPVNGTCDMIIRSSTVVGMTSPTTRLTFAQKSAIGSEWKEAAGPITDTWWQASWTISGGGSFPVFCVVGIH